VAERIRSVVVTITVDTNKQTYERRLVWGEDAEDETRAQFEQRIIETIAHLTELS